MERNFCRTCEIEFEEAFVVEFKSNKFRLSGISNTYNCSRQFLDNDGIVKSCFVRLIETLIKYAKTKSHRHFIELTHQPERLSEKTPNGDAIV